MIVGYFLYTLRDVDDNALHDTGTARAYTADDANAAARICAHALSMFPSESVWMVPGTIAAE